MLRWLWRFFFMLLFCGLMGIVILLVWIDPNDFKPQIVATIQNATGREISIGGDLGLEFFPHLSVSINSLQLGNSAGFDGPFLTLDKAHLKVRLIPLVQSRLEVVALNIKGLSLFLARNVQGTTNWEDLATPGQTEINSGNDSILKKDTRVPLIASLIVDGLHIANTKITWDDQFKKKSFEVRGVKIDVSNFAFGIPFDIQSRAQANFPSFEGELTFATEAVLELDRLDLKKLKLHGQIQGPGLPHSPESVQFTADFFSTTGRLDNGHLQGLGMDMRFTARETDVSSTGRIEVAPFSPKNLCTRLAIPWPQFVDPSSLGQAAFICNWAANTNGLKVWDLDLTVDNSTLTGNLEIANPKKDPLIALDLRVDDLNIDSYMIQSPDTAKNNSAHNIDLPVTELRKLKAKAKLAIGSLTIAHVRCTNALIQGKISSGRLVMDTLEAEAYGGRIQALGSLDVNKKKPLWTWQHSMSDVQLGTLLQDAIGIKHLSGTTQSTARLHTQGDKVPDLIRHLGGSFDYKVENGVIYGVNIAQNVRDTLRTIKALGPGPQEAKQTLFSQLSMSGTIKNGVETTHSLLLATPRLRITGNGWADLVHVTMDYGLTLHLQGSQGRFDEGLLGINSFPVRVSGPIDQPTITPDLGGVLRSLGSTGTQGLEKTLKGIHGGLKQLFQ